jgi:hypothetical protein
VPETGLYQIVAFGAQGGSGVGGFGFVSAGGRGAEIGGNFILTAGEVLQIAVGGAGSDSPSFCGGGGGTFVVGPGNMPLVIAGGGAGGGNHILGGGGLTGPDGGGAAGAPTAAVVAPRELALTLAEEAAGFSALVTAISSVAAPVGVRFQISPAVALAGAEALVAPRSPAPVAPAATVAAVAAMWATSLSVPGVVAAPSSTRPQTRSWSPISTPTTARS